MIVIIAIATMISIFAITTAEHSLRDADRLITHIDEITSQR